jgi:hypothetical protein
MCAQRDEAPVEFVSELLVNELMASVHKQEVQTSWYKR